MAGNREYKSDVFGMLMEEPGYALEMYNALNHSDYRNSGLVEVCSLERGISLSVRNDAAFILDMNLYCLTISLAMKPDCITLTGSIT